MQSSHKQVQFTDSKDVINVYSSAKTLQISYIGMQTQEVAIKPNLRVVLKSDSQMVDEVVVVAYGSAKKSSLTGSVDIVKAEQLTKVPVTSFDQALQGFPPLLSNEHRLPLQDVREQEQISKYVEQVPFLPDQIHYM